MSDILKVEGLRKAYRRMAPGFRFRTLKSALIDRSLVGGLEDEEKIAALEGIDFAVQRGEAFGVIGGNGSGKSTLLKTVAGILQPTAGEVVVDGRIAALIELGAGFHPEISGRENIFINAAVLGLSRKDIDARFDRIVEFSELGEFIDEPVKTYSSGMYVRLGFAVAIHADADLLLVDEVLSVGDEAFSHRCLHRIEEFLADGGSLLFVSHALDQVAELCDRVMWLDHGNQRMVGDPRRVVDAYRQSVAEAEGRRHLAARVESDVQEEQAPKRWGSRVAEVLDLQLLDASGQPAGVFASGDDIRFAIRGEAHQAIEDFVFGIGIHTPRGIECFGTNTQIAGFEGESLKGEISASLHCPELRLAPGEYLVDVAIHASDGTPYDYHRDYRTFTVTAPRHGVGLYLPRHSWSFEGEVAWEKEGDG